jgi:hypothetical protein
MGVALDFRPAMVFNTPMLSQAVVRWVSDRALGRMEDGPSMVGPVLTGEHAGSAERLFF